MMTNKKVWETQSYETFLSLIQTMNGLKKKGDSFLSEYEITQSQFNILWLLKHEFLEGASQRNLAQRVVVQAADMTGLIKRMLLKKWISRETHSSDTRIKWIKITQEGKALLKKIEPSYYAQVNSIIKILNKTELKQLAISLKKIDACL